MAELTPPVTQHQRLRLIANTAYASPNRTDTASAADVAFNPATTVSAT
jgi:hypothetical protein